MKSNLRILSFVIMLLVLTACGGSSTVSANTDTSTLDPLAEADTIAMPSNSNNELENQNQAKQESTCPVCEGSGSQECYSCRGSGLMECGNCRGKGYRTNYDGGDDGSRCTRCYGDGRVRCNTCSGSRRIQCFRCIGTGVDKYPDSK